MKLKQWLTSYQICFWFWPDSAFCEGWGEELGLQGGNKGGGDKEKRRIEGGAEGGVNEEKEEEKRRSK